MNRNIFYSIATKVLASGSGFLLTVVLAQGLTVENRGILAAVLVLPMILISVFEGGVRQSVTYLVGKGESRNDVISSMFIFWMLSSLLSFLVCYLCLLRYVPEIGIFDRVVVALFMPVNLMINLSRGFLLGTEDIKVYNYSILIQKITLVFFVSLIFYFGKIDVGFILICYLVSYFFCAGTVFTILVRQIKKTKFSLSFSVDIFIKLIKFGAIFGAALTLIQLNYRIDTIFIKELSDDLQLGYYSVASQFGELLWQVPAAVSVVLFSRSSATKVNDHVFIRKALSIIKLVFGFSAVISLLLFFFSEKLFVLFYGADYSPSSLVLVYLLPGLLFMILFKMLYVILAGDGAPILGIISALPSLVVNCVLNYYLIPVHGAIGAAISSSISYTISALIMVVLFSLKTGLKPSFKTEF
ncbi:oligosaccharide flippase family protein [Vibrio alginolyticus]|uniref:oligosaccharide flippase family protein n=1 Tax=Vibrio sp. Vb1729 TaxID=3074644 RepID=UPI002963EB03|nr:oligosaccharide flippase family protein [Vibrio sp. Vb1729]EGQ9111191.1 oligosaccharide flippase family protein [Vibrio alginolyticus]EJL6749804.1 oligosaccharide flippase family protein [Vibrio alginolyticus]EMA9138554.1 oligosaccharide flippase family protein [Vibrio alginolyticus]MDW1896653.1 oligosaccharide flippase family protein [Vibrio sp. Vb1729]